MAYCRWLSVTENGKRSDVSVYESECGFEIRVSGRHIDNPDEDPCPVLSSNESFADFDTRLREWEDRNKSRTVFSFPHVGESYVVETPGECADILENLRAEHLHVPLSVINVLKLEEESRVPDDSERPGL